MPPHNPSFVEQVFDMNAVQNLATPPEHAVERCPSCRKAGCNPKLKLQWYDLSSSTRTLALMPFTYQRTIRFQDTDAAGVVYFANVLAICHEAYEASLAAAGIDLRSFFSGSGTAIPIVHAAVDFLQPMFCGEQYAVQVQPTLLTPGKFEIKYLIAPPELPDRRISQATTIHLCIDTASRTRVELPPEVKQWLQQWQSSTKLL
jgi:1,4-dihydroxy-2-naphthoyl-CoA hydrolase